MISRVDRRLAFGLQHGLVEVEQRLRGQRDLLHARSRRRAPGRAPARAAAAARQRRRRRRRGGFGTRSGSHSMIAMPASSSRCASRGCRRGPWCRCRRRSSRRRRSASGTRCRRSPWRARRGAGHIALRIGHLCGNAAGEHGRKRADDDNRRRDVESLFHPFGFGFEHVFANSAILASAQAARGSGVESLSFRANIAQGFRRCKENCGFGNTGGRLSRQYNAVIKFRVFKGLRRLPPTAAARAAANARPARPTAKPRVPAAAFAAPSPRPNPVSPNTSEPDAPMEQFAKETLPVSLEAEMRHSYLDYAMSVIVGRALPDVRDGLKPVHRRVLYAMHEANTVWNRPYVKCARVVGDVMGKYHPHGDTRDLRHAGAHGAGLLAALPADRRPGQLRLGRRRQRRRRCATPSAGCRRSPTSCWPTSTRKPSISSPNYDGKEQEPTVLPSRLPNLLVNGSSGIAVGMATNIPPHNLTEVDRRLPRAARQPGHHDRRADRASCRRRISRPPASSTASKACARATAPAAAAWSSARARTSRTSARASGRRSSSTRSPTR